jgi:hypothetical protein
MTKDASEDQKFGLERRRLEADIEIRQAELDEKRAQRQLEEKRQATDAELKRLELSQAAGKGFKFSTPQATVAVSIIALTSGAIGGVFQAWTTKDVEATKSAALIQIEQLKAKANIALERQKFEATLIAKATEAPTREEQIRNLKFYVEAGFLEDSGQRIFNMKETNYPGTRPPPINTQRIDLTKVSQVPIAFSMKSSDAFAIAYRVTGSYTVAADKVSMHLDGGKAGISSLGNAHPELFPLGLDSFQLVLCYNTQTTDRNFYPASVDSGGRVEKEILNHEDVDIPAGEFSIDISRDLRNKDLWLCGMLLHKGGAVTPSEHF